MQKMSLGKGSHKGPYGPEGALEKAAHWLFRRKIRGHGMVLSGCRV